MDAETRRAALKEIIELNRQWYESGNTKGEELNLSGADLRGANLSGADLTQCDLRRAKLKTADFSAADLSGAKFDGSTIVYWEAIKKARVVTYQEMLRQHDEERQRSR